MTFRPCPQWQWWRKSRNVSFLFHIAGCEIHIKIFLWSFWRISHFSSFSTKNEFSFCGFSLSEPSSLSHLSPRVFLNLLFLSLCAVKRKVLPSFKHPKKVHTHAAVDFFSVFTLLLSVFDTGWCKRNFISLPSHSLPKKDNIGKLARTFRMHKST